MRRRVRSSKVDEAGYSIINSRLLSVEGTFYTNRFACNVCGTNTSSIIKHIFQPLPMYFVLTGYSILILICIYQVKYSQFITETEIVSFGGRFVQ